MNEPKPYSQPLPSWQAEIFECLKGQKKYADRGGATSAAATSRSAASQQLPVECEIINVQPNPRQQVSSRNIQHNGNAYS